MRVRMTTDFHHHGRALGQGQEYDLPDDEATVFLDCGHAVRVVEAAPVAPPPAEAAAPPVETGAAAPAPETAARAHPSLRGPKGRR